MRGAGLARRGGPVRRRLSAWSYLLGWRLVRLLPARVAYGIFARIADQMWRRRGGSVRRLESNLARVRPDLSADEVRRLSRAGLASYLRYWCDSFRLPSWSADEVRAGVRVEGDVPVRAALDAKEGVVASLAHQGNWDLAGAWAAYELCAVTTVAERLEPVEVFDAFMAYRTSIGIEALPLGDPSVFPTLMRRLRDGRLVPLLADRDLTQIGAGRAPVRPSRPDGRRPRDPRRGHRCAPVPGEHLVRAGPGHAVRSPHRHPLPPRGAALRPAHAHRADRGPDAGVCRRARARASPRTPRTGTCCSRSSPPTWTRRGWPERRRRRRDEDRDRLPVLARRPGRCAVPHPRPGRAPDRPGTRGQRAGAGGRRHPCPRVRATCRSCAARALQRLHRAPDVRARDLGPCTPVARRGPVRPGAPARAADPQPVAHRALGRRGPDRRHLPHLDPEIACPASGLPAHAARAGEDPRPHRCQRGRATDPGRAPRRGRGGDRQRRLVRRLPRRPARPAVDRDPRVADPRVPRPDRRTAQGPAGARGRLRPHPRPRTGRPAPGRRSGRRRRGPDPLRSPTPTP